MVRAIGETNLTALAGAAQLRPVHLVQVSLAELTVRLNDSPYSIDWDSRTWSPAGHLLGVGAAAERLDIAIEQCEVSLSGVDQLYLSILLQYDYRNRPLRIWRGLLEEDSAELIADPILIWQGLTSHVVIGEQPPGTGIGSLNQDGRAAITLYATNIWYDHQRAPGRVLSDACQRIYFPDDRGLEFSGQAFDSLPWGKP